ncbi:MAG: hypothetical protein FWF84_00175 [Kiritimatiellaeota bacterium]|nr:hypothetical protein [Kiritimatiellota bacterium]
MKRTITIALLLALFSPVGGVYAATIAEPATTFYGKVVGTADAQPWLITEGRLEWTIRRADGTDVTLKTKLYAYNKGTFSYRLDVPHSALSLGLAGEGGGVPLALYEQTHRHLAVTLDGEPVTLLGPAGEVFTSAQILRSATYRLDLGVDRPALDTDGDGVPDWWCDLHGLDKQGSVGGTVLPGGLTIEECYRLGLDPNADHTIPVLLTAEKIVYAGGHTALMLDAFDLDTPRESLAYAVEALPFGAVTLLDEEGELAPLAVGDTFTQADVVAARLIYQHAEDVTDPGVLVVSLSDGDHEAMAFPVRLLLYEPAISEVSLRSDLYQYANAGFVVAEAETVNAEGALVSYALAGKTLTGGDMDDVFVDTEEGDCLWTGGAGADRFIMTDFATRSVTIADFTVAEGDVLDITAFLPASGTLSDNVTLNGDTMTFATGLTVTSDGFLGEDLYSLVGSGALLTDLALTPRVSVVATVPTALRNGPVPGEFTVKREGTASSALAVNLHLSGSAVNGVDYQGIPSTVTIPAGASSLAIALTPYAAGGNQAVDAVMTLQAGAGYSVGAASTALVRIEPRKPEVAVEVLVSSVASKDDGESAYLLLWRDTVGASLAVENKVTGDAVRGADYQTYNFDTGAIMNPALVNFALNETEKIIEVCVLPAAAFPDGAKRMVFAPVASTRYAIARDMASAEITLIDRWETFEGWLSGHGGGEMQIMEGADHATLFKRYAYGGDFHGNDATGFPRPLILSDGMTVRVRQPRNRSDVTYTVKGFTDLNNISGSKVSFTEVPPPDGEPDGVDWRYYRLNTDAASGFMKVEVE